MAKPGFELAQGSHVLLPIPSPADAIDVVDVSIPAVVFAVGWNLLLIDPHPTRENTGINAHIPDGRYYQREPVRIGQRDRARGPNVLFFEATSNVLQGSAT